MYQPLQLGFWWKLKKKIKCSQLALCHTFKLDTDDLKSNLWETFEVGHLLVENFYFRNAYCSLDCILSGTSSFPLSRLIHHEIGKETSSLECKCRFCRSCHKYILVPGENYLLKTERLIDCSVKAAQPELPNVKEKFRFVLWLEIDVPETALYFTTDIGMQYEM